MDKQKIRKKYWYSESNEDELLEILEKTQDTSSASDELKQYIKDWPTEYQFSPYRQVLLMPFKDFFKDKTVLEIGAGMGAITRFLGENAKEVVGLEPSEIRAEANRIRCKDLENVEVIENDLVNYQPEKKFDVVVVIGVLEYAGRIPELNSEEHPHKSFLCKIREFLKPNGTLILAIENKLSMKYFLPNREDHTARFAESLQDFPNNFGMRTFSQKELKTILKEVGLKHQDFFYPFPDYKVPCSISTEKGLATSEDITHFLFNGYSREYAGHKFRFIDEYLLLSEAQRDGLLKHVVNSFLVFASASSITIKQDWLLKRYNAHRRKEYRNEITLTPNLTIQKKSAYLSKIEKQKLIKGEPMNFKFIRAATAERFISEWTDLLKTFYEIIKDYKKDEFDAGFFELHVNNIIIDSCGVPIWFDKETPMTGFTFNIKDLVIRNIVSLTYLCWEYLYKEYNGSTREQVILDLVRRSTDLDITSEDIQTYIQKEAEYQAKLDNNNVENIKTSLNEGLHVQVKNRTQLLELLNKASVEEIIDNDERVLQVSSELEIIKATNENLTNEINHLKVEIENYSKSNRDLQERISRDHQEHLDEMSKLEEILLKVKQESEEALLKVRQENLVEVQKMEGIISQKEEEIHKIYNSKSFKVGWKIRNIYKLLTFSKSEE